jgi:hypothetical protein
MHRSQHGKSEPSGMIQDSSDFSEVIQELTAYSLDKEKKLIRKAKQCFGGAISGFKQYSKIQDFSDVKP